MAQWWEHSPSTMPVWTGFDSRTTVICWLSLLVLTLSPRFFDWFSSYLPSKKTYTILNSTVLLVARLLCATPLKESPFIDWFSNLIKHCCRFIGWFGTFWHICRVTDTKNFQLLIKLRYQAIPEKLALRVKTELSMICFGHQCANGWNLITVSVQNERDRDC